MTIQPSFVEIGHKCHIISCCWWQRWYLFWIQGKKVAIYSWVYVLKVLFSHIMCCLAVLFHMLTEESPVCPAQRTEENKTSALCGNLLLENFCTSLNLPVNQNQQSHSQTPFSLFFAPIGLLYSPFSSCIAPQWVVDPFLLFFPPSATTILWLI